jgi:hypothetical protein
MAGFYVCGVADDDVPWWRDVGDLSRNNTEYTIITYATMYM